MKGQLLMNFYCACDQECACSCESCDVLDISSPRPQSHRTIGWLVTHWQSLVTRENMYSLSSWRMINGGCWHQKPCARSGQIGAVHCSLHGRCRFSANTLQLLAVRSLEETFKVKAVPYQRKLNISKRPGVQT